ncbi:hypothetical protein GCK72_002087 [Caenorhabditis remanei]|uniref:MAGE domain-containing protein n=1 Tax=Caenorhabditis remanei TaxID=31234 RepID=A0A6A5HRE4_CAERE|nr:hypothetical protein GCK72_002087 [Caenorhabditis remanei]KAF1770269.1 hypothetical protein GCK72_002087 [Caenorhabditis remanei]
MSSESDDEATAISREEGVLSYELYFWIVRSICEKGVVKISDLRKLYQTAVNKDRSVQYRPLQDVLKLVNENLLHWQGWKAVLQDDRLTYVDDNGPKTFNEVLANETERTLGVLKNALMYVFMATKPSSAHPGVIHDELMTYMETSMSTHADHKLTQEHREILKKQISPNVRADFIRKGYLAFSKAVNENDEEVIRYEWGPTAYQNVDPMELVLLFQKLTGMDSAQLAEQTERARELKKNQMEAIQKGAVLQTRGKQH